MPFCSPNIERAKPLLGTYVSIRVEGLVHGNATDVLNACFAEVRQIHDLMSFQEPDSDISRLNRLAHRQPVQVDARTYTVLGHAADVSEHSGGVFDITAAASLAHGMSSGPRQAPAPDPRARWSDVRLLPDGRVSFDRPLWIDVSGIAKGYAVDQAMDILSTANPVQACVNAGGDLRVRGAQIEAAWLDDGTGPHGFAPVVQLKNCSLASSGARVQSRHALSPSVGSHVDGITRHRTPRRFVAVMAGTCVVADALTKVALALGPHSEPVLRHFSARALVGDDASWQEFP